MIEHSEAHVHASKYVHIDTHTYLYTYILHGNVKLHTWIFIKTLL